MIDSHTHIGTDTYSLYRWGELYHLPVEELLSNLDKHGIEKAVIFPMPLPFSYFINHAFEGHLHERFPDNADSFLQKTINTPYFKENNYVLWAASKDKRLIPFLGLDPKNPDSLKSLISMIRDNEIRGIKFHGIGTDNPISSLENQELMDAVKKYDLSVTIHTGIEGNYVYEKEEEKAYSNPMEVLKLASNHPKTRFCAAHMGYLSSGFLKSVANLGNVWTDCSSITILSRDKAFRAPDKLDTDYGNPGKIIEDVFNIIPRQLIWGSDAPYFNRVKATYDEEVSILKSVDKKIMQRISEDNTRKFLNM